MQAEATKRNRVKDDIKKIMLFQNFNEKLSATGTNMQNEFM